MLTWFRHPIPKNSKDMYNCIRNYKIKPITLSRWGEGVLFDVLVEVNLIPFPLDWVKKVVYKRAQHNHECKLSPEIPGGGGGICLPPPTILYYTKIGQPE